MKIKKLPAEARLGIQSGILVTDAVQCVMELVQNSLDAEATGIAVRIDLKNYQVRVIDNGKGIGKDDLELVGERFMTSKYRSFQDKELSVPTYGCSGQALSSLQNISRTLTIETKPEDGGPAFVKVFQNGRPLPIREIDSERNGTGTAITIEDFMYAMPVRRKRINEVFDIEEIKNQLQYLAVIHYNVCFTLRNENKGVILLQTPQASSILESVKNIYGKSVANSLKALYCKDKEYEVTGFISVKSQTQNNIQLVYVNRRIITKGVIHKFINNLVKKYSKKESLPTESPSGQVIKSLKIFPHNVFIILITCPYLLCELFKNVRKTTVEFKNWTDVLRCVHRAVKGALKNVLNFNISHTQCDRNNSVDNEEKRNFGTSLLLNAVRGVPVKRGFKCKRDAKKRKKLKVDKYSENVSRNTDSKEAVTQKHKKENTNDSLESPIPKKNLRHTNTSHGSAIKKCKKINESFVEFYEWLKKNFESDTNAFVVYNDFLQFKSKGNCLKSSQKISEFKSPVLGGKVKSKKTAFFKKKSIEKTETEVLESFSTLDEEMAIATKNQLKILPSSHLRVKRGVQFTAEIHAGFPEFLKLNSFGGKDLSFEKYSSQFIFKKPEEVPVVSTNRTQVECNHTVTSLPSSELRFTNIIKFRNLSESFFHKTTDTQVEIPAEKTCASPASNSWISHYRGIVSKNVEALREENYVHGQGTNEIPQKNNYLENLHNICGESLDLVDLANKTREVVTLRDEEVQVDILKIASPAQKIDAMVQTLQAVPESPSFENSYTFGQETDLVARAVENEEGQNEFGFLEENSRQEVPNPDFWNTSEYMKLERIGNSEFGPVTDELSSRKRDANKKNSTSTDFISGHKSRASSKPQNDRSMSKEAQTIAALWTDSLLEIGYPLENERTSNDPDLNKSKAEDKFPKNLSNDEEAGNISRHTEGGFCITERHDIVPKGLSPEIFDPEAKKKSVWIPQGKCKMKLTVDNSDNETLANIKWEDESTGDCLKPKIPDGIFFEMSRRAEETAMNYGDPVLSATLSYCAVKVHNLLHSFTFTKELLSDVEILGQLDKKFIVTKIKISTPKKMELLSLFDQHAVDERIKLEELINENVSATGKLFSSHLNPPVECKLAESEVRIASEFTEKILSFGLNFEPVNRNTVLVTQAPSFLLTKHEKDLKNRKETSLSDVLQSLIVNILEEVTETRGAGSKTPKFLYNAFCLEACHKAIKFNKALSVETMTEMIIKLQKCTLPFQCAHGRPSVIPILDLEDFKPSIEEKDYVDLEKLKRFFIGRKDDDDIIQNSETVL